MEPFDYTKNKHILLDSTGRRLTAGLFVELAKEDSTIKPLFSLADWRRTYVSISDPTDYKAALHLIGDWEHWKWLLKQCASFAAAVQEWRDEVAVKLASEAVDQIRNQAKKPMGTAAAKWLAEKGWVARPRGRPRKEEEASDDKSVQQQIHQDYTRIMKEITSG